jgi:hypothetical protein
MLFHLMTLCALQVVGDTSLYSRRIVQDLTGAGRPDTVLLTVTGPSLVSARVVLTIRSAGTEIHRETWSTSGYLEDDNAPKDLNPAQSVAYVRHALQEAITLYSVRDYGQPPGATAAQWRDMQRYLHWIVGVRRPGENSSVLAWSRSERRFIEVESCC